MVTNGRVNPASNLFTAVRQESWRVQSSAADGCTGPYTHHSTFGDSNGRFIPVCAQTIIQLKARRQKTGWGPKLRDSSDLTSDHHILNVHMRPRPTPPHPALWGRVAPTLYLCGAECSAAFGARWSTLFFVRPDPYSLCVPSRCIAGLPILTAVPVKYEDQPTHIHRQLITSAVRFP